MFVPADLIEVVRVSQSGTGLFIGLKGYVAIITDDEHGRWALQLNGERPFTFARLTPNFLERGALYSAPRVEFDQDTMVFPEQRDLVGDLIVSTSGMAITGRSANGYNGDLVPFTLWGHASKADNEMSVGFQSWRVVTGPTDCPIVLWQHGGG